MDLGGVILTAAGLSFIGFGAQPGAAEWGRMVSDGSQFMMNYAVDRDVHGPGHTDRLSRL